MHCKFTLKMFGHWIVSIDTLESQLKKKFHLNVSFDTLESQLKILCHRNVLKDTIKSQLKNVWSSERIDRYTGESN